MLRLHRIFANGDCLRQLQVGHDNLIVVAHSESSRPPADVENLSLQAILKFDGVAEVDRAIDKNSDPSKEIRQSVLQGKTDGEAGHSKSCEQRLDVDSEL